MKGLPNGVGRRLVHQLSETSPEKHGVTLENVVEINDGWETDLYIVGYGYQLGAQKLVEEVVVRLYDANASSQAEKDSFVLREIGANGILVPRVLRLIPADNEFLQPILLMERVAGEPLSAVLRKTTGDEKARLVDQMARELVKIHGLAWQEFNHPFFRPSVEPAADTIEALISQVRETAATYDLPEFAPLVAWLEKRRQGVVDTPLCVLHNDFHAQNIIVRNADGRFVILDWSFTAIGDYQMDLAWTALLLGVAEGNEYRGHFISSYEAAMGESVEDLEFFEALKFTLRMAIIATWLDERVEIPVKKITKEAIRGSYKVHVHNVYRRLREITGIALPTIEGL